MCAITASNQPCRAALDGNEAVIARVGWCIGHAPGFLLGMRKGITMSQNRLTHADVNNRAKILSTKLNILHHAYDCLAGCYEQINIAFDGKHITLKQYDEFLIALGAIEDEIQASSLDYERIKALGNNAWTLRNRVLHLVTASKNAAAGWYEQYPGGPWKQGAPYIAEHLK
jgi:hypothetical protein